MQKSQHITKGEKENMHKNKEGRLSQTANLHSLKFNTMKNTAQR